MNWPTTLLMALALLFLFRSGETATVQVNPSNTQSEINDAIDSLNAGDTLLFNNGTYNAITINLTGKQGTSGSPITIRGPGPYGSSERPVIVADNDAFQEVILFGTGAQYIVVTGLRLTHQNPTGDVQAGIGFQDNVHDLTISDCEIDHISGIGVQMDSRDNVYSVTVQNCIIHHTGSNTDVGSNGGQGLTAGTFDLGSPASNVYDIRWIGNAVYETHGQEGDCMKFMYGVYGSQIVDNILWGCPRGHSSQDTLHGIAVYGGPLAAQNSGTANTVSGNMVVGTFITGKNNVGIYAAVGTRIINNLVIDSTLGIAVRSEGTSSWVHTAVIHNTVWRAQSYGFSVRDAQGADATVIIANNVFSVDPSMWPNSVGYCWYQMTATNAVVMNNYYDGDENCDGLSPPAFIPLTSAATAYFANPGIPYDTPGPDFMCNGTLVDAGIATSTTGVTDDFDGSPRSGTPDVGCYEATSQDHWAILLSLKGSSSALASSGGSASGSGSSSDAATLRSVWETYVLAKYKTLYA